MAELQRRTQDVAEPSGGQGSPVVQACHVGDDLALEEAVEAGRASEVASKLGGTEWQYRLEALLSWRSAVVWLVVAIYLTVALCYDVRKALAPTLFALLIFLIQAWAAYSRWSGNDLDTLLVARCAGVAQRHPRMLQALLWLMLATLLAVWVVFVLKEDWHRVIPAAGLLVMIGGTWCFSAHRRHVVWRPILCGLAMQLFLGILVMRTRAGYLFFHHLGQLVQGFLDFADEGSKFVFGDDYSKFFFAFKVLPVIIYFSSLVSVAFHVGLLQACFSRLGWLMQRALGTAYTESLVAAANIFIGQTEAPLLVKPFLENLTISELHAVMTTGFATIAGGVMAAYVAMGIPPEHLVTASVMSCPAALAMAKLSLPETEISRTCSLEDAGMAAVASDDKGILDAMASGVSTGVAMVATIAGNLIAFVAVMALLNSMLAWAGSLVGITGLTFEVIFSYVFWPLALLMGVPPSDCGSVGLLLGEKTFINEFVAYKHLADMQSQGVISKRAEIIATYALCGFSNFGSIGVQIGGLSIIAPSRKHDVSSLALRAMITGTLACFMTACVAGMLVEFDA